MHIFGGCRNIIHAIYVARVAIIVKTIRNIARAAIIVKKTTRKDSITISVARKIAIVAIIVKKTRRKGFRTERFVILKIACNQYQKTAQIAPSRWPFRLIHFLLTLKSPMVNIALIVLIAWFHIPVYYRVFFPYSVLYSNYVVLKELLINKYTGSILYFSLIFPSFKFGYNRKIDL